MYTLMISSPRRSNSPLFIRSAARDPRFVSNVILIFANWSIGFTRHVGALVTIAGVVETTTALTATAAMA